MGYHVKIEELLEVQNQMISQLSEWGTQLESVYQALETIVVTPCIQGETGKSIQNYIQEVHIPVIRSLQQLLTEFQVRLSVYAEGYYGIDSSYEAEIPQEILEEQQQALEKGRKILKIYEKKSIVLFPMLVILFQLYSLQVYL